MKKTFRHNAIDTDKGKVKFIAIAQNDIKLLLLFVIIKNANYTYLSKSSRPS